jgi:hypothetical protein
MSAKRSYFASVSIRPDHGLARVAEILSVALDGFLLCADDSGRFEECLAFTDEKHGVEIQLVGDSTDERSQADYSLTLRCLNVEPSELGARIGSKFLAAFPTQLPTEKNGYVNISQCLSDQIAAKTDLRCYPAWIQKQVNE